MRSSWVILGISLSISQLTSTYLPFSTFLPQGLLHSGLIQIFFVQIKSIWFKSHLFCIINDFYFNYIKIKIINGYKIENFMKI